MNNNTKPEIRRGVIGSWKKMTLNVIVIKLLVWGLLQANNYINTWK